MNQKYDNKKQYHKNSKNKNNKRNYMKTWEIEERLKELSMNPEIQKMKTSRVGRRKGKWGND